MNYQRIIIFLALIFPSMVFTSELKLVQVLFRHGDRAPTAGYEKWYPTDPYINENYEPVGRGGLTQEGHNRSFVLGQFLRCRYFTQLKISEYSRTVFRVRSSDVDRCRESAKAAVAALFPGVKSIPIYYKRFFKDFLFLGVHICPKVRTERARAEKSMKYFDSDGKWASLNKYLSGHLGVNATRYHAFILHHTLMAQSSMGLPLPSWTKEVYPSEDLEKNAAYEYILQSYNTNLKKINGGMWIREFVENMENVVNEKDEAKMVIYVGHETNIAGLLTALDSFQPHVPDFCSCVILELYQDLQSEEHYVRLFYKTTENIQELYIPRCSVPCSLKDFQILTKNIIPRDMNSECGLAT